MNERKVRLNVSTHNAVKQARPRRGQPCTVEYRGRMQVVRSFAGIYWGELRLSSTGPCRGLLVKEIDGSTIRSFMFEDIIEAWVTP